MLLEIKFFEKQKLHFFDLILFPYSIFPFSFQSVVNLINLSLYIVILHTLTLTLTFFLKKKKKTLSIATVRFLASFVRQDTIKF